MRGSRRRGAPRLRDLGELEDTGRELPRVLPLLLHPPRALRGQPAEQRRRQPGARGGLDRGPHGPLRGRRDHVARRQEPRAHAAEPGGGTGPHRPLLPALPEPPHKPPPRLRHDPPPGAPRPEPHRTSSASGSFPGKPSRQKNFDPSYASDFWDVTNRQDWHACESVQRGVSSRGYRRGPLSPREDAVYQLITMVANGYLEGRVARPASRARSGGTGRFAKRP